MANLGNIIKHQTDIVEEEAEKLEELKRLRKLGSSSNTGVRVDLKRYDTEYYKLHVASHELNDVLDEIYNMTIVEDTEIDVIKEGKVHLKCKIEYTPTEVDSTTMTL